MTIADVVATLALAISIAAFVHSVHAWKRSFRPIVTAMVRTKHASVDFIAHELVILNSGTIPAKNVSICVESRKALEEALSYAPSEDRRLWLTCFDDETVIRIIHNGSHVSCSFGTTQKTQYASGRPEDKGFWKYGAELPVIVRYRGWFGRRHEERQVLDITDSESFTGHLWGTTPSG
ncbi:hypothetical protein [Martelella mangrovi]|uniref:SMODS-associating 2TM beta-strand rich effector domain-containing protein n=1 Tax=Martelella mangrovi TaxID=1397477 RepID=A0ABV2IER2_9HYPH